MSIWNDVLADGQYALRRPDGSFYLFLSKVEHLHSDRPLRSWDMCCGAGRHTVPMALRGWSVYASDSAEVGIEQTKQALATEGAESRVLTAIADMTEIPWPEVDFHAVVAWDAIHHNTVRETSRAVDNILDRLVPGGLFFGSVASDKAWKNGHGEEIEPGTFITDVGADAGAVHHFYTVDEVQQLLDKFEILVLGEYMVYVKNDRSVNPFGSATWRFIARRPG